MKDYKQMKIIAELLQRYKELKKKEKELSNDAIKKSTLDALPDNKVKIYVDIDAQVKENIENAKNTKSEMKEGMESLKSSITSALIDNFESSDQSVKEETLSFPGIGTVSYKRQTKYIVELSDEDKRKLIDDIIKNGEYDLIQINEEQLIEHSKGVKKTTGNHIHGIREIETCETKIK